MLTVATTLLIVVAVNDGPSAAAAAHQGPLVQINKALRPNR
jgi:hypothetical protein